MPLVNSPGTSITCTTQADFDQRIAATGANSAADTQNNAGGAPNDKGGNNNGNKGGNNNGKNDNKGNNAGGKNATATASATSAAAASATANAGKNATAAAGGKAGGDNGDPQKSLTLDPKVIAKGFANNGQDQYVTSLIHCPSLEPYSI